MQNSNRSNKTMLATGLTAVLSMGTITALAPAQAAPVDLGNVAGEPTVFSNSFDSAVATFSDSYTFTVPVGADLVATFNTLDVECTEPDCTGVTSLDVDNFSYILQLAGADIDTGTGQEQYSLGGTNDSSEVYTLIIEGDVLGTLGGAYAGTIAAVPLPPALFLLGSALVGLVGIGRRAAARS